jgi:hypothetical protein
MEYNPNRALTPDEFVALENLYEVVREFEGQLLPIGRHANLCKWLDEHGYGSYYNNKPGAMRIARQLLNNQAGKTESDEDFLSRYEDEL